MLHYVLFILHIGRYLQAKWTEFVIQLKNQISTEEIRDMRNQGRS
jgi:hypothetical protein